VNIKFSLLTILLLNTGYVIAEEWTSIIKDKDHEVFVDIDSYNVSENLPYLIAKTTYQETQEFKLPKHKIAYRTSIATYQFNCKEPIYRVRSIKLYNEKKLLVDTVKISGGFQSIPDQSDEFSIGQLTCQVHQMLGGA
jgi:hypothetical protein